MHEEFQAEEFLLDDPEAEGADIPEEEEGGDDEESDDAASTEEETL